MLYVLMAYGENDVQMAGLIWTDKEQAVKESTELLGPPVAMGKTSPIWETDPDDYDEDDDEDGPTSHQKLVRKVFTKYNSGCGAVYTFDIIEVEPGKPFTNWDLD